MEEGKRVNNVRSSERDLTRAAFIFREHGRQKPFFSKSSINRWTLFGLTSCHVSVTRGVLKTKTP